MSASEKVDITEPGFVYDMSDEVYHADPVAGGSLSSTFTRLLTEHVPAKAKARREGRRPTKSMNLGKAAHAHALGAGPELIVWQHDGRTKEGKAERAAASFLIESEAAVAVTAKERDQILGMAAALRAHPEVARIIKDSVPEVSAFAKVGDTWIRVRIDLLSATSAYDYKTCEDASRRGFQKSMATYGYHQQAELYERVLHLLGHRAGRRPMRFICQETEAPYLVQIHEADSEARDAAKELNDRAIRIFAECNATGEWPGYAALFAEPTPLPAWYFFQHEDVLELDLGEVELKL